YAVFMEVQARMPEVNDADDDRLIQMFATMLPKRYPSLNVEDYQAIAFVMVKAIGNLMWLSFGQSPDFRKRLIKETKRLSLSYLQSYGSVK
ncbi:MAG: TetR/AcrR family transcriptional regulator, partial [Mastigocoleus sp.]